MMKNKIFRILLFPLSAFFLFRLQPNAGRILCIQQGGIQYERHTEQHDIQLVHRFRRKL